MRAIAGELGQIAGAMAVRAAVLFTLLRRAVTGLGMVGAMLPSRGLPLDLGHKTYWPVYAEAERLGCENSPRDRASS